MSFIVILPIARTFCEHVNILAREAPQALMLDWWRRFDRVIDEYFTERGELRPKRSNEVEARIGADSAIGPVSVSKITRLRQRRNRVAHDPFQPITYTEAADYANQAFRLIGTISMAAFRSDPT